MINPNDFVAAARSMLGLRFHHQGRSEQFGVDCAGLAVCAARKCGFEAIDFTNYKRTPNSSDFLATIRKNCVLVKAGEERPGDLWIFEFANNPQHLAIQTESNPVRIIHAYAPLRKVVEHDIDATWMERRRAVFRIKEEQ